MTRLSRAARCKMAQDGPGVESRGRGAENKSVTTRTFIPSTPKISAEPSRESAVGQVLRQNCFHALEALVRSPASRNLPVSASFSDDCPSRKFHAGHCGSLIFKTNRRVNRFAAVPESDERNSLMCTTQRDSLGTNFKAQGDAAHSAMVFGFFRQPVVGSVDAIHQPRVVPRPGRFRAVESGVVSGES